MTTKTDRPNRDALSRALDIYRDAMRPFIVRCLKRISGKQVEDAISESLSDRQAEQFRQNLGRNSSVEDAIDINDFPNLVSRNWPEVFSQAFKGDRTVQNLLWIIVNVRNEVAHPGRQDMDAEHARSRLYDLADLIGRINKPEEKRAVEGIRDQLFSGSDQSGVVALAPLPQAGKSRSFTGLTPWREVIRPNTHVALGTFQEAEFAADLQQVYDGRASATEYGNPVSFFNRTYITPGIRTLLVNTLKRLSGNRGDPVIQTKTGFGGGKTHSLIALYHLVKNADALINPTAEAESKRTSEEIRGIMGEAGSGASVAAKVAVLDGTYLATTDENTTDRGDPLNTLWGVMAYQLGGQEAYEIVGEAARQGTAPGGAQLDRLFRHVGPCVILMDELVAYVRNAGDAKDSIYTFIQSLTQSVRRNDHAVLVVTLPERAIEAGGEGGADALNRLDSIFGRIEAVWEPLEVDEAFEVVRRRLFGSAIDEAERDRTCEAFARMYSRARRDYLQETGEQRYLDRLKDCYPIHPEIFDRLYHDWSSIPRFQRTRGVLRMMANCISRLYLDGDASPLIMPGNLRLDDPALANEFINLLPGRWEPVLSEVDSNGSRTDNIDRANQRFMDVGGAARRIARTIFLGSATSGAVKGIDDSRIRLGVVQPGQGIAVYNEALARMSGDLYYLYHSDDRHYFHAEENLNKVATDRAGALSEREVEERIVAELREAVGRRADVVVCPQTSGEVRDLDAVQLVILPPRHALPSRSSETDAAADAALCMLKNRGDAPRVHRNALLFLAAKNDELRALRTHTRAYLAWDSIVHGDRRIDNLTGDRRAQAINSLRDAQEKMVAALVRAYRWAMAPVQDNPQQADYRLSIFQTNAEDTGEIVDRAFEKFIEQEALVDGISPASLGSMLAQYVWQNEAYQDHIGIDTLWKQMTSNAYMHRLRNKTVLLDCIEQGVPNRNFGYAEDHYDDQYKGLRFGDSLPDASTAVADRALGLLVNPEMAQLVQAETPPEKPLTRPDDTGPYTAEPQPEDDKTPPAPRGPRRIIATKTMQGEISLDDARLLSDEIIRNLRDDGGEVTVEITIRAHKADGFSESTARAVRENSVQLDLDLDTFNG